MPSRGVQDYQEYKQKRREAREKKQKELKKWCSLAGLTIMELVLCFICLALAYTINQTIYWSINMRYLLLPTVPIIVSSAYLLVVIVDLISWIMVRPVTYFAWIAVSTSAFLMFMVYTGVCMFNKKFIIGIVGMFFGVITALVFLGDAICSLLSLKRFPMPYWVLKRKFEKFDECVCTGDHDPNAEKEIERPFCRCGESWGEPCTCDAEPDPTCGCGAAHMEKPPCPCCECSTQALVEVEDGTTIYGSEFDNFPRKSIVTTASGRDYLAEEDPIDPRKSTFTQVTLIPSSPPDVWCVDPQISPQRKSMTSRTNFDPPPDCQRKSTMSRRSELPRKSTLSHRGQMSTYSVYTATVDHNMPSSLDLKTRSALKVNNVNDSNGDAPELKSARLCNTYSTDEEYGVGDFSRNKTHCRDKSSRKKGTDKHNINLSAHTYTSNIPVHGMSKIFENTLPGQASSKNVSVTAKMRERRATTSTHPGILGNISSERLRPKSEHSSRTVIRNVSTTVRPVRVLSSLMETSQESGSKSRTDVGRRPDTFPSESTITINK